MFVTRWKETAWKQLRCSARNSKLTMRVFRLYILNRSFVLDVSSRILTISGTRYNYCLVVDDVCLESLEKMHGGVVKLLRKDFLPLSQDEAREIGFIDDNRDSGIPAAF
ncbi:hypothetical protein F4815DRAFT_468186 [Daldinia loculata]|nr:hypothetical protein F4815DRAFT_468186 [Daldinia loculata]